MARPITALIKPASSMCNMACSYCFYREIAKHREQESCGIMNRETARQLIIKTLSYADGGPVNYCFQGGEPLLVGIDFYYEFLEMVKQYNTKKSIISYALQTNGILLDEEYCRLFRDHTFLIGVSLDGAGDVHDRYRTDCGGKGTFERVLQGIERMRRLDVEFNILSVVTRFSARNIRADWDFFRKRGYSYLQYIVCLEPLGTPPFSTGFAMDNEEYYCFQKTLFDLYRKDNLSGRSISVRHLDNLLVRLQGGIAEPCDMQGRCFGQLVVEADGSVYPCDFYCEDRYDLGNICRIGLDELRKNPVMKQFVDASLTVNEKCLSCDVGDLCRGGCRRERDYLSDGEMRGNIYCEGRRKFYRYVLERIRG